jgi:hypothetical protein
MRNGIGLAITDVGTKGGVADAADGGGAENLLAAEAQGFAVDFTDNTLEIKFS